VVPNLQAAERLLGWDVRRVFQIRKLDPVDYDSLVRLMIIDHDVVRLDVWNELANWPLGYSAMKHTKVDNIMGMHRCKPSEGISQNALLGGQGKGLPGEVEKMVGEILIHEHLLARDGVLDGSQIRTVGELWLKSEGIVVLGLEETLQNESLLVGSVALLVSTVRLVRFNSQR
jgi:hypothetical protein